MESSSSKTLKGVLILALLDIVIIWIWATNEDLGPGSAMVIYLVVPFVFIVNTIIGGILFFAKRAYSAMFFINCIVASIVTNWIFSLELRKQSTSRYDIWIFILQDTTFRINKSNEYNDFSISYSTDAGSSTQFMMGQYKQKKDTLQLKTDSASMYIYNNKLYNFRQSKKPIALKVEEPNNRQ